MPLGPSTSSTFLHRGTRSFIILKLAIFVTSSAECYTHWNYTQTWQPQFSIKIFHFWSTSWEFLLLNLPWQVFTFLFFYRTLTFKPNCPATASNWFQFLPYKQGTFKDLHRTSHFPLLHYFLFPFSESPHNLSCFPPSFSPSFSPSHQQPFICPTVFSFPFFPLPDSLCLVELCSIC